MLSVRPPYTSHRLVLRQLRQRHISYGIYAVVILILWLVRIIAVLVLTPSVAAEIRQQADAPACHVYAVTLQDIQPRHDAVITLL